MRLYNKKTRFSHVGMIDVKNNGVYLLHADPKLGCVCENVEELFRRSAYRSQLVLRIVGETDHYQALAFCMNAVERHLPFNKSFRYQRETGYYCTEFIVEAYASVNIVLLNDIKKDMTILPEHFCHSPVLEVVFP